MSPSTPFVSTLGSRLVSHLAIPSLILPRFSSLSPSYVTHLPYLPWRITPYSYPTLEGGAPCLPRAGSGAALLVLASFERPSTALHCDHCAAAQRRSALVCFPQASRAAPVPLPCCFAKKISGSSSQNCNHTCKTQCSRAAAAAAAMTIAAAPALDKSEGVVTHLAGRPVEPVAHTRTHNSWPAQKAREEYAIGGERASHTRTLTMTPTQRQ